MNKIVEKILKELNYVGFKAKQRSVTRLWPNFRDRVAQVIKKGGVSLYDFKPNLWHFKVASGTKEGLEYDVYVEFKNIPQLIDKYVADRRIWKKDLSDIDYLKLADKILKNVDMNFDCSCPADLYWGEEYIRTKKKAQYGRQENRPPRKRNPREYGITCKHGQVVLDSLPSYLNTFADYLKKFYRNRIIKVGGDFKRKILQFQKAAKFLAKQRKV